ncbi:hypothetical protein CEXT_457011 [Caerostris extrusa]|uniref:Uncharacterized protein n=1 Tax=Caerostris extrusa TaxID=172846 RepID=A0AAV4MJQ4_CAEEX|nr:hypothetical protein CEXT_457011 [Caerostris extrusa]
MKVLCLNHPERISSHQSFDNKKIISFFCPPNISPAPPIKKVQKESFVFHPDLLPDSIFFSSYSGEGRRERIPHDHSISPFWHNVFGHGAPCVLFAIRWLFPYAGLRLDSCTGGFF